MAEPTPPPPPPHRDPRLEIPEVLRKPVKVPEPLQRERRAEEGAKQTNDRKETMRLWAVGMNFVGGVGGGCLLGYVIDRWQGTNPWGVLIGAAVGLVGGFWGVMREVNRSS